MKANVLEYAKNDDFLLHHTLSVVYRLIQEDDMLVERILEEIGHFERDLRAKLKDSIRIRRIKQVK